MRYIKRFFEINESKSDDSNEKDIKSALDRIMGKDEYIIEFKGSNKFILKKRETDPDEIRESKERLESVAKSRGDITQQQINDYLNNLSTYFSFEDIEEFEKYLKGKYFIQIGYYDDEDYIYELEIKYNKKKITLEEIGEYVTTNLAYLNDEYPFEVKLSEINFGLDIANDNYKMVYTAEIVFDEDIDLDSVRDYLIPFLYKAESEGMLYTFTNNSQHGCIYLIGRNSRFYTIDELDKESNFVMGKRNYTLQIMFDS